MNLSKINKFIIFILIYSSSVLAETDKKISYIDINFLMNNSLAGKSISSQLKEINKSNISQFKKEEELLKTEETKIISQKNVISEKEFKDKVQALRIKVNKYRDVRNKKIRETNSKKVNAEAILIKSLTPILANYLEDNNISLVIQKKNIIIGKSELDITKDIIEILDKKTKKIKLK